MSTKRLSRVATDVITAYGITATNVINAYRFGGERLVEFVDTRFASAVNRGASALPENLRISLIGRQQQVSGFYVKGVDFSSARAHSAVGVAVDVATKGVSLVADNAERLDRAAKLNALDALTRVVMPAADVVSKVAERIEEGSTELVKRVAGKTVPAKFLAKRKLSSTTRQAAATRKRVTKSVTKATTQRASKVVADAATSTSNAARRVARQAKSTTQRVNSTVSKAANKTSNTARRVARQAEATRKAA